MITPQAPLTGTYKIVNRTPAYIAELITWCVEHDLDANEIRPEITFNPDGTITFMKYLTNEEGHRYVSVEKDNVAAYTVVTVKPKRGFPVQP